MFPLNATVRMLAETVGGKIEGDADLLIKAARPLNEAGPGDITFLENAKNLPSLEQSKAAAAVVGLRTAAAGKTVIRVAEPLTAFIAIAQKLQGRPVPPPSGIDPRAGIDPNAVIGAEASIAPFASVGAGTVIGARCRIAQGVAIGRDCKLGDDVVLHPNVVLYDGCILGNRVTVHANSVLGADGFGYRLHEGRHVKVPQLGYVDIGDDVEIGACTTIDRAAFGSTRIGAGTKIDNLVQVGHNCQIGKHVILVSQVGIAGSCTVGDYAALGGQVGVSDHKRIGAGAMIGGKSGITRDVPPGARMFGYPARPEWDALRLLGALEKVPQLHKDMARVRTILNLEQEPKKQAG